MSTEFPEVFTCVDCDSGDMDRAEARWHEHHEGHCVVALAEEDYVDETEESQ